MAGSAVARVRQQAQVGVMADALADEAFCRAGRSLRSAAATASPRPSGDLPVRADACLRGARRRRSPPRLPVGRPQAQSSNTDRHARRAAVPQVLPASPRWPQSGVRGRLLPDRRRALRRMPCRSRACSSTSPATARSARWRSCRRTSPTRATAGNITLDYLKRFLETRRRRRGNPCRRPRRVHGTLAHTLGRRTAELHQRACRQRRPPGVRSGAADRGGHRRRPRSACWTICSATWTLLEGSKPSCQTTAARPRSKRCSLRGLDSRRALSRPELSHPACARRASMATITSARCS